MTNGGSGAPGSSGEQERLRFTARNRAVREHDIDAALIAIEAGLIAVELGEADAWLVEVGEMSMRGHLIASKGEVRGHPVLDLDSMVEWFDAVVDGLDRGSVPVISAETVDEMRRYRRVKNALRCFGPVLDALADDDRVDEVRRWWAMRELIP